MTHRRGPIWTERMLLGLILLSLAGTLNLLVAVHRRALSDRRVALAETPSVAKTAAASPSPVVEAPSPDRTPLEPPALAGKSEPQPPPRPAEDPTQKAIAALAASKAKEIEATEATDRRTAAIEAAYRSAAAESDRWKRREMLVRQQIAGITADAEKLERDADALDAERDVLERERDATKAALAKASKRSGFSVLPYKGPNGTWRRPIVIECAKGGASLQPHGPKFTVFDLSPRIHPRSSVFVKAVARELFHIRSADTPDGSPAVPYIVFLVRPDGVGPYYLARTCLEPLGIAFGYELVEQNLVVNIPDFDDVKTWDGTTPLDLPLERAPAAGSSSSRLAQTNQALDRPKSEIDGLPEAHRESMTGAIDGSDPGNRQGGQGSANSGNPAPEDFVWPGRGRGAARNGGQSPGAMGNPERGTQVAGADAALPSQAPSATGNGSESGVAGLGALIGQDFARGGQGVVGATPGKDKAAAGGGDEVGTGRYSAAASGIMGFGDLPEASGSGTTPGAVNAEDVGTGAGAGAGTNSGTDPAERPFAGSGRGTGRGATGSNGAIGENGPGSGVNATGGGSSANDTIFQVPNFEPARDGAAGPASLVQPGVLSGPGSQGATGAGVQAPAFGLGQTVKGSAATGGDSASPGTGGAFTQSGGTMRGGAGLTAPGLGGSQATDGNAGTGTSDSASDVGSAAQTTGGKPASGGAAGTKATGMGSTGQGMGKDPGQGQGRGFDWSEAAKDGPPPAGSDAPGTNPAQGAEFTGVDGVPPSPAAAARANAGAGGALNRSIQPASIPPGLQNGAYQAGQYSQEDIDRAKSLSGLSSLVSPGLAQKLAGLVPPAGSMSAAASSPSASDPSTTSLFGGGLPSSASPSSTTTDSQFGGMPSSATASAASSNSQPSGMASSIASSSNSTNNQSGGMPLGGNTQSSLSSPSSSSGNSFGLNSSPSSDDPNDLIMPPKPKPALPMGAIEAPFQIVVVCRKDGVVLHPGSYRLTDDVLRSPGQGTDCLLAREIRAMVRNRSIVDPMIQQKPSLRFLVEAQGGETFALARQQLLFSLPDWPVSLQVSGAQDVGVFSRNPF